MKLKVQVSHKLEGHQQQGSTLGAQHFEALETTEKMALELGRGATVTVTVLSFSLVSTAREIDAIRTAFRPLELENRDGLDHFGSIF